MPELKWLMEHTGEAKPRTLADYGDYAALRKALSMTPEQVIEEMKASGVRGRGGAGFPAGMKWSFVPKNIPKPRYLCCNADESEPGTFKDRIIMEKDPHLLLEGMAICCHAVGIKTAYIYIRGEYPHAAKVLNQAIAEAKAKKFLGQGVLGSAMDLEIHVHRGAGAYICGEETGLLESLEGKRGHPRIKPPFPAVVGLFGCPTVINNVETLAAATLVFRHGAAKYKAVGTEKSPGTKMVCVSGHVKRPGTYEIPLGLPLNELLNTIAGGPMKPDRPFKAIIPGGSSAPIIPIEQALKLTFDYEAIAGAGSMLGSGGLIALDTSVCLVDALWNLARFYAHESCGQCTPCREGTGWLSTVLERIERGQGRPADLDLLDEVSRNMCGTTICVLSDSIAMPVRSYIKHFRPEFEAHIKGKACPFKAGRVKARSAVHG
ncbi:MAG: NADH-quinone oxidoreductase subunit NuoF [Planctomycetota bacterium]